MSRLPLSELEELDGGVGGVSSLGEVGGLGSGVVNLTLLTLGCSSVDLLGFGWVMFHNECNLCCHLMIFL